MLRIIFSILLCLLGFGGTLFLDPLWGMAVFSIFTHITPQQLSYDIIVPLRIPFVLSIWILINYLINGNYPKKFSILPLELWLMILMLIGMFLGTMNAITTDLVYLKTESFVKFIIFYLLLVNIITSEYKIKWFINAQILSASWLVYRCWDLRGSFSGRFENIDGGVISDSNHFAAAVVLLFPLVVRRIFIGHWVVRIGAVVGVFAMVMTVIITGSRGGFLGLATQAIAFVYFYKEYRKKIIMVLVTSMLVISPFVSDYYIERVTSIFSHEEIEDESAKASAESRLASWALAFEIFKDKPLLGCGIGNFGYYMGYQNEGLNWGELGHVTHSIWLQTLGEGGLSVFIPFFLILFLFYRRTFATSRFYIQTSRPEVAQDIYSLQIGLTGFLVCATFLNRLFYEPIYWFSGLAVAYSYLVKKEVYDKQIAKTKYA